MRDTKVDTKNLFTTVKSGVLKTLTILKSGIQKMPIDLKWTLILSLLIWSFWIFLELFSRTTYVDFYQYSYGWSPASPYSSVVFILVMLIIALGQDKAKVNQSIGFGRVLVILSFGASITLALIAWIGVTPEDFISDNPYLKVSPYQVIYTVYFPLVWVSLIGIKTFKDYKERQKKLSQKLAS